MTRLTTILVASLLLIFAQPVVAGGDPPGVDPLIPGRAIVRLPQGGSVDTFLGVLNSDFPTAASVMETYPSRNLYLLQHAPLSPAQTDDLEETLENDYVTSGLLVYGELLYEGKAPEGSSGSVWVSSITTLSTYSSQYFQNKVHLPVAHQRSTGGSTVVAVLDTGIDSSHPQIAGRIAPGGYNFVSNSTNTADVGDGQDNDNDGATDELVGHGTFTAGIIALTAPDAKLLPITVLNSDGKGDNWWIAKGVFHAIDRGVEVINMSLTSTYDSMAVIDAIEEATTHGIVVVAAAGNWNRDEPREYPAMDDDIPVLGVIATDDNDVKGSFSNYSDRLFICAPGVNAMVGNTAIPDRSIASTLPNNTFGLAQGTSMATPVISGAAALIRSQHPEWAAAPAAVTATRSALATTAVNINAANPGLVGQLGHGRADVGAAVALGPVAPDAGDLDNDGHVNINDLLKVITEWGLIHTSADIDGNGLVEINDLLTVISNWH